MQYTLKYYSIAVRVRTGAVIRVFQVRQVCECYMCVRGAMAALALLKTVHVHGHSIPVHVFSARMHAYARASPARYDVPTSTWGT